MRALAESVKLFGRDLSSSGSVYRIYREVSARSKYAAAGGPANLRATAKYRPVSRINTQTIEPRDCAIDESNFLVRAKYKS